MLLLFPLGLFSLAFLFYLLLAASARALPLGCGLAGGLAASAAGVSPGWAMFAGVIALVGAETLLVRGGQEWRAGPARRLFASPIVAPAREAGRAFPF
ncbi:hypothetical protein SAMN05428974_1299 [Sphingopyxis sp. YR583]|uniref:hypothetical protein n=1 Tax=Sphingopyxis sp. YR583 TaxID=1881047 RepID=UPI0008A7A1FF|nr:hypothetical protein [Sphingopyxis sp. YR583]SEH14890.1 hypothetical protein SAMN05428974_1299 [Sphingopyxis sp. YR583]